MAIKAIETTYKGYRFRSRLEARWAVFFDVLGVPYEYEPQGVVVGERPYLPDFWLPTWEWWVEVKPEPSESAEKQLHLLELATGQAAIELVGQPWPGEYMLRRPRLDDVTQAGVRWPWIGKFAGCRRCDGICVRTVAELGKEWYGEQTVGPHSCGERFKGSVDDTPRLTGAYDTARGIRFDRAPHLRRNGVSWSAASGQAVVLLP